MRIFKKTVALREFLELQKNENKVGFVPTMGALHAGHRSLIDQAKQENDFVVCSIFVNPTQFNDPEDFKKYPITIEADIRLLLDAKCDVLFLPSVNEVYPEGTTDLKHYDLGYLETILEGKFRPGHFQGVCQVMHRLLTIVLPHHLYLGQKDYQQCMVIKRLSELVGLDKKMKIIVCPTLREADGLAMSSRNRRLSTKDRLRAGNISRALRHIRDNIQPGDLHGFRDGANKMLSDTGFITDYVEIADAATLELLDRWNGKQKLVTLAAAYLNNVRLIDNMVIDR